MANIDRYRQGYEDELRRQKDTSDEVLPEQFVKGLYRAPAEAFGDFFTDDDYIKGRDDARFGREFNPGDED